MVKDSAELPIYNEASHWHRKNFVFNEVSNKPDLADNIELLNFYDGNINANMGKFMQVNVKITEGNHSEANTINASIAPGNQVEQNQQVINDFILRKLLNTAYDYSGDMSTIYMIALQCPIAGGDAVYQARNLFMSIINNVVEFEDNCDGNIQRSMKMQNENNSEAGKVFKLYPNPTNGNMLLDYTLSVSEQGMIKIYDVTGSLVASYELNNANNQLIINNEQLNNGIYFYKVLINNKPVTTDKLVIVK